MPLCECVRIHNFNTAMISVDFVTFKQNNHRHIICVIGGLDQTNNLRDCRTFESQIRKLGLYFTKWGYCEFLLIVHLFITH